MFWDRRSKTTIDRRGMRHDTDIGAWEPRWSSIRQRCAGKTNSAGLFDMQLIRPGNEAAYVRRLYALFCKHRERSTEEKRLD